MYYYFTKSLELHRMNQLHTLLIIVHDNLHWISLFVSLHTSSLRLVESYSEQEVWLGTSIQKQRSVIGCNVGADWGFPWWLQSLVMMRSANGVEYGGCEVVLVSHYVACYVLLISRKKPTQHALEMVYIMHGGISAWFFVYLEFLMGRS